MIFSNIIENKNFFFLNKYVSEVEPYFFSVWHWFFKQSGTFNLIHDLNLPDRFSGTTGTSDATWKALERNFEKV